MTKNSISDRLRDLRTLKGVSQEEAAESCGMSRIALARYETGTRIPRAENAARLADYYGVTVDYLLGREDFPIVTKIENAPADDRAEAKRLLEGMSDEQYQAALQYLKFLKAQK